MTLSLSFYFGLKLLRRLLQNIGVLELTGFYLLYLNPNSFGQYFFLVFKKLRNSK